MDNGECIAHFIYFTMISILLLQAWRASKNIGFHLFPEAPWLSFFTGKSEDTEFVVLESLLNTWDFRVWPMKVNRCTCCRQRWMLDSSTWLLFCHCFSGSLHQASSPPTQHHRSQAVWQMVDGLTPLELDSQESLEVRSRSIRGGQSVSCCAR